VSTAPSGPLLPAPLVVTGQLVTFDDARPQIPDGVLYVDRDGVIVAVSAASDPPPPGFATGAVNRVDATFRTGVVRINQAVSR